MVPHKPHDASDRLRVASGRHLHLFRIAGDWLYPLSPARTTTDHFERGRRDPRRGSNYLTKLAIKDTFKKSRNPIDNEKSEMKV